MTDTPPPLRRASPTHPNLPIDARVRELEARSAGTEDSLIRLASQMADLTDAVTKLTTALQGPDHEPHKGILWRLAEHDRRRDIMSRIAWIIITALGVTMVAWLLRLSYIVQSAKVP